MLVNNFDMYTPFTLKLVFSSIQVSKDKIT
jgi:hypothetical protein